MILDRLERQGACSYQELAEALGVSTMTVRREVDRLASKGAAIKTLGGVQKAMAPPGYYETPLSDRFAVNVAEKRAIAERALGLIAPGQTIFLDPSTTCLELARRIGRERESVTVVTNSALACLELGRGGRNTTIGIGGQFDPASGSFVGSASEEWLDRFFVDRAFVSTKGFLPAEGTFEAAIESIRIKQVAARRCSELVLLADHTKFGIRALCKALDSGQIHTVVTDAATPETELRRLERAGKRLLVTGDGSARLEEVTHAS
ncbi:DeoR/GlpR family DNA-binding transcription regulator [Paludisphaera mucosa]|uniref:DeoR/GlpR family DNA-binding transcription regulator n=1 Tax=Paludisphaera mucosa TaxID=3030827 RepID=A0ABT6FK14_9BACT|nr:DeoR/GlpR family DNA-binding transcription regulator [Paludisphaera mucosa]MDG3007720.1 DeoR/GlpR family DNA-binding transcription regulator [Paludisphaera mucosa]